MSEANEVNGVVMCDTMLKAEVFRVIRENSDKTAKQIKVILNKHLPDIEPERLRQAICDLYT